MSKYIGTPVVSLSTDTVDVTGDITTTDATPEVIIVNDTHEDTDGGREGKLTFKGQASGGEETTLAQIQASHDGTSDDEKGDLIFKTNDGSDGANPTEALRIDSEQNLGLGTNSPDVRLHVTDSQEQLTLSEGGSKGATFDYRSSTGNLNIATNGIDARANPQMTLDLNGKLGIGTATGSGKLTVQDSSLPKIQANFNGAAHLESGVGGSGCGFSMTTGHFMTFNHQPYANAGSDTNLTERMRISDTGTLQIGSSTNAGYGPLQIGSTSTSNTVLQMLAATNGFNVIHMGDATSGTARYGGYIQYDQANDAMNIGTNSVNRLAIASDGQTSMTGAKASYFMWSVTNSQASSGIGTYRSKTNASGDNTSSYHFVGTSSSDRIIIYGNGNIQNTNNSYTALSDSKLKENIVDSGSQWDDIKAIRVRKYSMKEDELDTPNRIGVISQELEEAGMNNLVFESADRDGDGNSLGTTTKAVKYSILYMKAIKALQEAMAKIETLETQNTTQATQITDLITRVTALEGA